MSDRRLFIGAGMSDLFLERDAVISDCGQFRYPLRRTWQANKPRALFVMLGPLDRLDRD
jgi:hypothetical protein